MEMVRNLSILMAVGLLSSSILRFDFFRTCGAPAP